MEMKDKQNKYVLFNPYELEWGEEISFPSSRDVQEYGNRIYNRYPARSIFLVPRAILANKTDAGIKVLDPFMGSGTTAVETVISGNNPYGLEMDPFAKMVAEVSSTAFSYDEISRIESLAKSLQKNWKRYAAYETPNLQGIERWFKDEDFIQLLQLRKAIEIIIPEEFKKFFLVTFADAIKPVSLMERQSLKPYISTKFPKETKSVGDSFSYSFEAHLSALKEMASAQKSRKDIYWIGEDATDFHYCGNDIDIAITSPPYINALDYTRCIKIESALCGTIDDASANHLRQMQVGHERRRNQDISNYVTNLFSPYYALIAQLDLMRAKTCLAYFNDIYKNLGCVFNSLKQKGEYHVIIGDNTIKGVDIPTHDIIRQMALSIGFSCFGYYKYAIKDHRTSIPRNKAKSKIQVEHVLMLKKS